MPDPTGTLSPAGQMLEDAAILRRVAREIETVAKRYGGHHASILLVAADDCAAVAHALDGKR